MNLAGGNSKRLLRSLRTGATPTSVGLWAAVNAVQHLRKRRKPAKVLLVRKDLEPGATYVVRIPEEGQPPISQTLSPGGIGSELMAAAADLLTKEESAPEELEPAATPQLSRRKRRRARRVEEIEQGVLDVASLRRGQRRKLGKAEEKARRRPTRKRAKKARRLQRTAAKSVAKAERNAAPSRRARRKRRRHEEAVSGWEAKNEKHSTRRRRRKLARARQSLGND
ncbi:MAG: hypothetical protein V3U47_05300 [Acidimicrobiia bacterium]